MDSAAHATLLVLLEMRDSTYTSLLNGQTAQGLSSALPVLRMTSVGRTYEKFFQK